MRKLAKRSICTLLFTIVMLELIAIAKRFFRVLSSEFCRVWKGSVVHFWEAFGPPAKRFGSRKSCWNVICTKQLSLIIAGSGAYQLLFRTSRSERERERGWHWLFGSPAGLRLTSLFYFHFPSHFISYFSIFQFYLSLPTHIKKNKK